MKYGYFDDLNKEYVIETPQTPWPWINYLGSDSFFSLVSQSAGGYSFYKDARLRRLTRYRYNNAPIDEGGRYFYIKEDDLIWNPGWKPCKEELDFYQCRHGLGYSIIISEKNNIRVKQTILVPIDGSACELQKIEIINKGNKARELKLYSYLEFCLWNAWDDQTNFQRNFSTGEVEVHDSFIYHKTEYRERRNHYSWYGTSTPCDGFDTDRESFLGLYNGMGAPQMVKMGESRNSIASGWSPIASQRFDLKLEPEESKRIIFQLGYTEIPENEKWLAPGQINIKPAQVLQNQFASEESFDKALQNIKENWNTLLNTFKVETPDKKTNRMVNIWNQYQCTVTYNMARSASFFESGIGRGIGFRDTSQDMLGCVHQFPERVKTRLLDVAAIQFRDGSAFHQFQPLTKKGNADVGGDFNDDPLWLIMGICRYIKETGDFDILKEEIPFADTPGQSFSLLIHLEKAFNFTQTHLGPHNLPLIGRADWNDCLNLNCFSTNPDDSFQTTTNEDGKSAESLMIAGMFVYIGREFAELISLIGKDNSKILSTIETVEKAVEASGWDGEWFLRAYDAQGAKVGSQENKDGKIFIESQGFCSMAQIGKDKNWPRRALDSVKKHLTTDHGIMILSPAFKEYHLNLGEVSSYPPGYKENGGIFCHNNPWIIIAEAMEKQGQTAFDYYSRICPAYREDLSDIHKTEPYVYSQMIAGEEAPRHGEAKNSWLTGTASWNFVAISQWILGIRPHWKGLTIDPCIPKEWPQFKATRHFRGKTFDITVLNPNSVSSGIKSILVNDDLIDGNTILLKNIKKDINKVIVTLG